MSEHSASQGDAGGPGEAEMVCTDIVDTVTAYVEGTMPADDRRLFEVHLAECPWCVTYVEQIRETIEAVGRVSDEPLSAEAQERIVEAFRDWRSGRAG